MKKNLLKWLFALCAFALFSGLNAGEIESYGPQGKNLFKEASDRILVKFSPGISFEAKFQILSKESNILPLSKEDVLPAPDVSIVRTKSLSDSERIALFERLQQIPSVEYANPFVIYSDGTYQGIQDRIIVRLKSQKDISKLSDMAAEFNLLLGEKNEFDPSVYVLKTTKQSVANALEVANRIHEKGIFEYAEPDFLLLLKRFSTNDPLLPNQWSLNNTGSSAQFNGTPGADMNIFNAWGITSGSSTIKVAIIDEGVDLNHPDLVANLLPGYDAAGLGSNGGPSGNDAHGTACAGIVAAVGNNNVGIAGVAYSCKIIPVRIAYSNTSGNWVTSNTWIGNSLNWAWQTAGADILSNSWGGGSPSTTINNAISGAVNNGRGGLGSPVLFAAGNSNGANGYPATEVNTISVIAMSMCYQRKSPSSCDGETFWGSNYGAGADVAAPGVKIATTDISGSAGYSSGDYTGTFNGTSSACPNAAGVMALILSANPALNQTQARFTLESTCQKVGGYSYNSNVSGQPNGTWSNDLGYGMVNAFQALQSITPQAQTDAGISQISDPLGSYCFSNLAPSVTLKNFGTDPLSSVTINYQIGSNPIQTYQWTGNLASTISTNVTLPTQNFQNGNFTFLAYTSNPNNTSDEVPANDSRTSSFTIANNPLTLTIVLDNYPSETSWSILDGSSNIVASGGTYSGSAQGSTLIENLCLSDGCYTFVMNDSYGDGICCAYGNGSYTLTKDSDGSVLASGGAFTFSESTGFCVQESSPLSGNVVSTTNVSCFNGNNGSAEVEAQGGTSPYFYSWSSGQNTAAVSNLAAGTYNVTITDNAGSQVNVQVTITQPSLLTANASAQSATCSGGSNGSVSLSVSGGTSPYSYSWSNGSSSQNLSGIEAGSYSVVITDANGCTANASANVSQPTTITASASSTDASCNGANDGSVSLSVSGGTPPYSYSWSNGASSQNLSNVGGGSYSVVVTDANGCNANASANVNTGVTPEQPQLACYETATFNTNTCSWDVSGTMPVQPQLACYETATFNTNTCSWDVSGTMPVQPQLACYETATFNTNTCSWDVSGTMPVQPQLTCYETASFNTNTCTWDVTGEMPAQPATACYETATFNTASCSWEVNGEMPAQPAIACYETASFNTASCSWEVSGEMPAQPAIACYETATFNTATCSWDVRGDMPTQPLTACYETASFNTNTCTWDVTGEMPTQPNIACYETATFNASSCSWDVSGEIPAQPTTSCYETATFNTASCSWEVSGEMPTQPATACYETASFNTASCSWEVNGEMPAQPAIACYETATFNTALCSWEVSGDMPPQPATACYETASFNTASCSWEVSGEMPPQPATACYETASFNTTSCSWEVSGDMPAQPATACYETASFNTASCSWEVSGEMPAQPATACYETATFNTASCSWEVAGEMPPQPQIECYEVANFNTISCAWEVSGSATEPPNIACYETATFNSELCQWDITGEMPPQPATSCYETASFNTASCSWEVSGEMPPQPAIACYETASFNTTSCSWEVSGDMPAQPTTACYETASFNTASCSWEVAGEMPPQPQIECYEVANFNTISCAWEVSGSATEPPNIACYETATFNSELCQWDITGEMPAQPATACYETASFNTTSCSWNVTGDMPAQPAIACYETASFNTASCSWEVSGEMPAQPAIACYETASFNTTSCSWDVSGEMPAQPVLACYETASFNTASCSWEVIGEMPAQPTIACYETASFNTASCSWEISGEMPAQPALACYETASFNTASCSWDVTGSNITASTSSENVSCNGGNDGSVSLSVSGGTSPYSYNWSNGSNSQNLSGVGAGSYSVTITDANGCSAISSASVGQPTAISLSLTSASVTCNGNDGGISSSVSGGTPPYSYSWSNGSTSSNLSNISEGSYTLTVADANGCENSSSANVITDCNPSGCTYVTIDSQNFESGFGIWNDGGVDCARINNATYASSGNFTVSLQDDTEESVVTTNELNLLGFTELTVAFNYVPVSMDNATEDFWLQVSYNGGATFSTIEEWNLNDEFVNDQSYSESVTFQGPFNANTMLRFRCDASGNADWVYLDDIIITGCQGEIIPTCTDGIQNGDETGIDCGGANCAPCGSGCKYSDLNSNDFESGFGIWNDGGGDAALVTNSTYSTSGSRSMELRDNSGVASSMTTDDIDLTGYSELTVSFNFVTVSFENNEDFFLEYSLGGGVYSILAAYQQGNNTQNGVAYSDAVVIQGPFTSTTSIRFRCDASNNSDWVYIDDVVVSGCYNGIGNRISIESPQASINVKTPLANNLAKFDFNLFPNPVSGMMNIRLINLNDMNYQLKITDMSGKLIETSNINIQRDGDKISLNSEKLASGLYNISIHTATEVLSKRFIVQH